MVKITHFLNKSLAIVCVFDLSQSDPIRAFRSIKVYQGLTVESRWRDTEQKDVERQQRLPVRALANR